MYKTIPVFDKSLLTHCEEYIHHASQFLAMAGKNYLEDQPDDSNANLWFNAEGDSIQVRKIGNISMQLNVPKWRLEVKDDKGTVEFIELLGQNKNQVFDWLKKQLGSQGLDGEKLQFISHYDIHEHALDNGQAFPEMDTNTVNIWLTMRSNANLLLADLNSMIGVNSEVRVWPHHFDTGTYYELGSGKAIGAGWAMADALCDNPYLYLYGRHESSELDYSKLPTLGIGKWRVNEEWKGAILESEELSFSENQYESVKAFMQVASTFLKSQLNK